MNWIKENKIRIIMIAVALLAVIGTVIVVTRRSGKAQTTDNNQSDVVINESSKEDVTTKKNDVIKESESTTEEKKEEETTSKDDKSVEEETTPAAAEPTTPYVAPTTKPQVQPTTKPQPTTPYVAPTTKSQAKPTTPQAKPTTPQPTRPTEPATTAPVIHGKDGVILDTLYFNFNSGLEKLPESQAELGGPDRGTSVWTEDVGNIDIFGVGLIMGKSTKEDVEAYFGKPLYEKDTEDGMVIQYMYKNVYILFNFNKDTGKIRAIVVWGEKGLDYV